MKSFQKIKRGDNIAFVGINSNDPACEGEGMDNMKEAAKAYGATCTPDPFLFDKNFNLVFHGRIDDALEPGQEVHESTMDENIQKLVSGEEIGEEFRPSMGCSIKWIG